MRVSIICTNYNKGDWIGQALDSFLKQERDFPIEILVVDDASTDHSPEIIRTYAARYPELIRAFFNPTNLGISKTWKTICLEAKGDYIARCDGDDYWTDPQKLAKQLRLLESNEDSRWSNTDFDFVSEDGQLLSASALQNGVIPFMDSYEKMLALKGMTMSSTWLVERDLMLEVNELISDDATDDTFELQLELFRRTQLAFLPQSTTVYRLGAESDSRSLDRRRLTKRFEGLYQTQLTYFDKYPDSDWQALSRHLLARDKEMELSLALSDQVLSPYDGQFVTIYAERPNSRLEENSQEFTYQPGRPLRFELPEDTLAVRIDLSELPGAYRSVRLIHQGFNTYLSPFQTTGFLLGQGVIFDHADPQLWYDVRHFHDKTFSLEYDLFNLTQPLKQDYVAYDLGRQLAPCQTQLFTLQQELTQVRQSEQHYRRQLEELIVAHNSVLVSRRWRWSSAVINLFRRKK